MRANNLSLWISGEPPEKHIQWLGVTGSSAMPLMQAEYLHLRFTKCKNHNNAAPGFFVLHTKGCWKEFCFETVKYVRSHYSQLAAAQ